MVRKQNPKNLGEPNKETGLRAKGWDLKKIRDLEPVFEKLSHEKIQKLLNRLGISFVNTPIRKIDKNSILWTIADDWTFEQLNEEIDNLNNPSNFNKNKKDKQSRLNL